MNLRVLESSTRKIHKGKLSKKAPENWKNEASRKLLVIEKALRFLKAQKN